MYVFSFNIIQTILKYVDNVTIGAVTLEQAVAKVKIEQPMN